MAFERIPSGYPGVDEVLDNIRMGDNVVWQVIGISLSSASLPSPFARPRDSGRPPHALFTRITRRHEPLLEPCDRP